MEAKIYIENRLGNKWRELAMKRFGYGKGSISKAAEEAIARGVNETEIISKKLDAIINYSKSKKDVVAVILFGSYARNENNYKDIDIAVLLSNDRNHHKILSQIEDAAGDFEKNSLIYRF